MAGLSPSQNRLRSVKTMHGLMNTGDDRKGQVNFDPGRLIVMVLKGKCFNR